MLERRDPLRGLLGVVLGALLVALTGWFLVIGKAVVLPIIIAVISVYVLTAASHALARLPCGAALPEWLRRVVVLMAFLVAVITLAAVMTSTADQVRVRLPEYQRTVAALLTRVFDSVGADRPDWQALWDRLVARISFARLAGTVLASISAAAGMVFMVVVYAIFLMAERDAFGHKIAVALPAEHRDRAEAIIRATNTAIRDYLAIKTLVNAILATISFVVMWAFGVDFALFWAILIGLLNYIPYVGSTLGVAFPVVLSMAQFGALSTTLGIAALLTAAQVWVGNALEPRLIGRTVNMSPFVVMVALALWSSLWGIAGAILAIPLTSIIAIIMANFRATRPFAVLLAKDVSVFEDNPPAAPPGPHRLDARPRAD